MIFVDGYRALDEIHGLVNDDFNNSGVVLTSVVRINAVGYNAYYSILSTEPFTPPAWAARIVMANDHNNVLRNVASAAYSQYTVDGVTYHAAAIYIRAVRVNENWGDSSWYFLSNFEFTGATTTLDEPEIIATTTDGIAQAMYQWWILHPDAPYMDINVYTHGADGNKMITAKWDNLDNIPSGMYSTSYFVVISASDKMGASPSTGSFLVDGIELAVCPYKDKIYQLTWVNAFNSLTASQQSYIVDNNRDYLYVSVALCHNEDGRVVDQLEVYKVSKTGGIDDEGGLPDQGGTSDTHPNTSPRPNGDYDGSTGDIDASGTGQALAIDNIITTSYAVTEQQLNDFGDWLWTNDLSTTVFGNQVAPIENVLSCKRIPFNVATASNTNIWLGNINSGVACVLASTNHYQDIGSIQIPTPCGGTFLDEQNNVSIYLPYCGIQSIPTSICYDKTLYTVTLPNGFTKQIPKLTGRTLTVKYVFDMIYGTCAALLYMYDDNTHQNTLFAVYNGTCGVDIPLTASNRASNQLALQKDGGNMITGIITSAVGGAVSGGMSGGLLGAAIGGIIGAGESALGGALRTKNNAMTQETHFTTSGGFSSQIASFMSPNVTIFVEYTDIGTIPDSYAHENGYPCNLDLNLSDLVGYTELDGAIEISNIPCLEEERVLLKQALQDGFYL